MQGPQAFKIQSTFTTIIIFQCMVVMSGTFLSFCTCPLYPSIPEPPYLAELQLCATNSNSPLSPVLAISLILLFGCMCTCVLCTHQCVQVLMPVQRSEEDILCPALSLCIHPGSLSVSGMMPPAVGRSSSLVYTHSSTRIADVHTSSFFCGCWGWKSRSSTCIAGAFAH